MSSWVFARRAPAPLQSPSPVTVGSSSVKRSFFSKRARPRRKIPLLRGAGPSRGRPEVLQRGGRALGRGLELRLLRGHGRDVLGEPLLAERDEAGVLLDGRLGVDLGRAGEALLGDGDDRRDAVEAAAQAAHARVGGREAAGEQRIEALADHRGVRHRVPHALVELVEIEEPGAELVGEDRVIDAALEREPGHGDGLELLQRAFEEAVVLGLALDGDIGVAPIVTMLAGRRRLHRIALEIRGEEARREGGERLIIARARSRCGRRGRRRGDCRRRGLRSGIAGAHDRTVRGRGAGGEGGAQDGCDEEAMASFPGGDHGRIYRGCRRKGTGARSGRAQGPARERRSRGRSLDAHWSSTAGSSSPISPGWSPRLSRSSRPSCP